LACYRFTVDLADVSVLFPNLWEDLEEDGGWLLLAAAFADFSVATWTFAKILWFVLVSTAYVYVIYKIATLLFG